MDGVKATSSSREAPKNGSRRLSRCVACEWLCGNPKEPGVLSAIEIFHQLTLQAIRHNGAIYGWGFEAFTIFNVRRRLLSRNERTARV